MTVIMLFVLINTFSIYMYASLFRSYSELRSGLKENADKAAPEDKRWLLICAAVVILALQNVLLFFMLRAAGLADYLYAVGIVLILLLEAMGAFYEEAHVRDVKQRRQEQEARVLGYYARQYEAMSRFRQKIREDRHERKNRNLAMLALVREKDLEGLEEMLSKEQEDLGKKQLTTGNMTVDAVLEYETSAASANGITLQTDIAIPSSMDVSAPVLCGVLGNGLDNAIEAASRLPAEIRSVSLYMRIEKRNLFIEIKNSYDGFLELGTDGLPFSRKELSADHGIGLRTIKELAQQTGGTAEFFADEKVFTLRVLLCHAI